MYSNRNFVCIRQNSFIYQVHMLSCVILVVPSWTFTRFIANGKGDSYTCSIPAVERCNNVDLFTKM